MLDEVQAGVFVEPENQSALVQAIKHLYQERSLRQTLGRNGRNYIVEHLSREQTAKIYTTVLENVVLSWKNSIN